MVAIAVAQRDCLDADLHDVSAEARRPVLHHHAHRRRDLAIARRCALLLELLEDVGLRPTTLAHLLTHQRVAVRT
jgi:hypothetical protein